MRPWPLKKNLAKDTVSAKPRESGSLRYFPMDQFVRTKFFGRRAKAGLPRKRCGEPNRTCESSQPKLGWIAGGNGRFLPKMANPMMWPPWTRRMAKNDENSRD